MTIISDENFSSPEEINEHPCLASSRYLNAVPEEVRITDICQDSYNTSLVIINFTLVGTFQFTPKLKILAVDDDTSYSDNGVVGIFAQGHIRNVEVPILTNCNTFFGTLVYDIGSRIPNYTTANSIQFELVMDGVVPQAYGVSFPNQSCSSTYTWFKGVLPKPIQLTYEDDRLVVLFEYEGSVNCNCNVSCTIPSGVAQNIVFCPGEQQSIYLYPDLSSTDPYTIAISLADSLGNQSFTSFQSLAYTKPRKPNISFGTKPKRIEVSIFRESENGSSIEDEAKYKILRYQGNRENTIVWKDCQVLTGIILLITM